MPLVRIDIIEGRSDAEIAGLADGVQEVMEAVFAAPAHDRYQIVTEHKPGRMFIEDTGLGLERTAGVTVVHVFQQGRDVDQKQAFYAALADRLEEAGVRREDLVVSMSANEKPDWSFGMGRAQFVTGEL